MRPKFRPGESFHPARPACAVPYRRRGPALPPAESQARCRTARLLAAAFVHVQPQDLDGTRGRAPVTLERHVALYVAHVTLGVPQGAVAVHFGRDRTSIAYACARMEQRRDAPEFDRALSALEACAAHAVAHGLASPAPSAHRAGAFVAGGLA
ncbi:hypothetical protein [Xanthobacter sp. VNH20]|uniref:hypothetical protein n=1 Tax=Xanthobacter sp. VNH20 TaxID=3156616 RepID=UPI0032B3EDDA